MAKTLGHDSRQFKMTKIYGRSYRLAGGLFDLRDDEYEACPHCLGEASSGYDGIDYCRDCDVIIEGEALLLNEEERERIEEDRSIWNRMTPEQRGVLRDKYNDHIQNYIRDGNRVGGRWY